MTPQEIFADYQTLLKMKANDECKIQILQLLTAQGMNNWRVVGITQRALQKFAAQDFKYISRCGIQRAHIFDRHSTYSTLVKSPQDETTFWDIISKRDKTILAVKGEYNSVSIENAIQIADGGLFPPDEAGVLFRAKSIGFECGTREAEFLRELHQSSKL